MKRGALAWGVGVAALVVAVLGALAVGRFPIAPTQLWAILTGTETGTPAIVFWNIRAPRVPRRGCPPASPPRASRAARR